MCQIDKDHKLRCEVNGLCIYYKDNFYIHIIIIPLFLLIISLLIISSVYYFNLLDIGMMNKILFTLSIDGLIFHCYELYKVINYSFLL